jgi:hypothetical protein
MTEAEDNSHIQKLLSVSKLKPAIVVQADGMLNTVPISLVVILQLIRARTPAIQMPNRSPIKALKLTVPGTNLP